MQAVLAEAPVVLFAVQAVMRWILAAQAAAGRRKGA